MMDKKVSIIVPTIGRASLRNTLASILNQSYQNLEIIVTDDTPEGKAYPIVKEFNSEKIKYVKNEKYKRGPSGNKNNGLDFITGDYFTFVDDDDVILPEAIETLIKVAEEKGYSIVIANCLDSETGKYTGLSYGKDLEWTYEDWLKGYLDGEYFGLVATDLLGSDRFNDECWGAELLLWWKILKKAKKGYYLDRALKIYSTIGSDRVTYKMEKFSERQVLSYYYILKEFGEDLLKVNPKQYARYLLRGIYFAKIADDLSKLNFFKESISKIENLWLKMLVSSYYWFCILSPKNLLVKLNAFLYKSIIPFVKAWFRK